MREVDEYIRRLDPDHPEFGLARKTTLRNRTIESLRPDLGPGEDWNTLENGGGQLSEYFAEVSVSRREDKLRVTEAGPPLMGWVLSTITVREMAERIGEGEFRRRVAKLAEALEREISENGEIHVTKDAGLFAARV